MDTFCPFCNLLHSIELQNTLKLEKNVEKFWNVELLKYLCQRLKTSYY